MAYAANRAIALVAVLFGAATASSRKCFVQALPQA